MVISRSDSLSKGGGGGGIRRDQSRQEIGESGLTHRGIVRNQRALNHRREFRDRVVWKGRFRRTRLARANMNGLALDCLRLAWGICRGWFDRWRFRRREAEERRQAKHR